MCTNKISRNYSKIKDLDINNHFYYTKGISPKEKHISSGLKEYQKHILKSKIQIPTNPISIQKSCNPRKPHVLWTEVMAEKHSIIKDLDINNHYQYTHFIRLLEKT